VLQHLPGLLVHQVARGRLNGKSQKCHGVAVRVEENVRVRAGMR
jgi:hypothetical protein